MSKKAFKGLLDLVLILLLVMLYNKNLISMAFHEIAGLTLCGLFLIHKGLNLNWIKAVGKKLFTPGVSGRAKAMMYLDIGLLVAFALIAVSGLAISKVVLRGSEGQRPSMEWTLDEEAGSAALDQETSSVAAASLDQTAGSAALDQETGTASLDQTAGSAALDQETGSESLDPSAETTALLQDSDVSAALDPAADSRSAGSQADDLQNQSSSEGRGRAGGVSWQTIHYFCSALALVLVGVHLGLHSAFIRARLRAIGVKRIARGAAALLMVAAVGLGAYGLAQTSFTRWISMPFASQQAGRERMAGLAQEEDTSGQGDEVNALSQEQGDSGREFRAQDLGEGESQGTRQSRSDFAQRAGGHGRSGGFNPLTLLSVLGAFGGIVALIGMLTGLADNWLLSRIKKAAT